MLKVENSCIILAMRRSFDNIASLPEAVLSRIFQFLEEDDIQKCRRLNKSWNLAVNNVLLASWNPKIIGEDVLETEFETILSNKQLDSDEEEEMGNGNEEGHVHQYHINFRRSVEQEKEGRVFAVVDEFIITDGCCAYQHYEMEIEEEGEEESEVEEQHSGNSSNLKETSTQTDDARVKFPEDGRVIKQHKKLKLNQVNHLFPPIRPFAASSRADLVSDAATAPWFLRGRFHLGRGMCPIEPA